MLVAPGSVSFLLYSYQGSNTITIFASNVNVSNGKLFKSSLQNALCKSLLTEFLIAAVSLPQHI